MAARKRIGLLVPSTNATIEPDFQMAAPRSASFHFHHIWSDIDPRKPARSEKLGEEFLGAARFLTPMKLDALCLPQGNAAMEDQFSRIFEIPAVASSPSVLQALRRYEVKRLSIVTPYDEWVNTRLWEFFANFSFTVLSSDGDPRMQATHLQDTNAQEPAAIAEFATSVCDATADAIILSSSSWRALEAADMIEQVTGKLVITTNQATLWRALVRAGVQEGVSGFGRLLRELPPCEDTVGTISAGNAHPSLVPAR